MRSTDNTKNQGVYKMNLSLTRTLNQFNWQPVSFRNLDALSSFCAAPHLLRDLVGALPARFSSNACDSGCGT
jgi:hypothetical protein